MPIIQLDRDASTQLYQYLIKFSSSATIDSLIESHPMVTQPYRFPPQISHRSSRLYDIDYKKQNT